MKNKYSSVIMFKERFNPMDDIIVSFAYTNNESADKGAIRLQGSTYNNELLNSQTDNTILYNQPSDFNGLGVFLMDGKIAYNSLSGGGMSSAVSAFDLGANLINSPYLSSGLRFLRQPNNLSGSFVPSLYDKKPLRHGPMNIILLMDLIAKELIMERKQLFSMTILYMDGL